MNIRNEPLLERFAGHPLRAEIESALGAAEKFAGRVAAIKIDKHLSPEGKTNAITKQLRATLRDIRDAGSPIDAMRTKLAALVASIKPVSFAKDDLAGALLRQDLRVALRNMSLGEKAAVLLGEKADAAFVDATLEAPGLLSGVDPQMFEQVREQRLETMFSAESFEAEALSDQIAEAQAGLEIARGDLSRAANLPQWEFDKLATEIAEKRDAPWLKRDVSNGAEQIVVVRPGQSHYPVATPDDLRDGKYFGSLAEYNAARAA
jgi:hypothetical protein